MPEKDITMPMRASAVDSRRGGGVRLDYNRACVLCRGGRAALHRGV